MRRAELRALLEGAGIRPTRAAGQNFLVEDDLARAIARDGGAEPEDVVLEIGTGTGVLTRHLLGRAHHVVSVERDGRLLALARDLLGPREDLTLVEADALATKNRLSPELLAALRGPLEGGRRLRVTANLPYAVATSLVVLLLGADLPLESMVVLVQLEAAERFAARRGDPSYGAVSVLCGALCSRVRILRRVPPDVFMPRPRVTSAVVRLDPRPERLAGFAALDAAARGLFGYRRKTLARAARQAARRDPGLAWLETAVARCGLDPTLRPEDLDLQGFRTIAEGAPG